MVLYFTLAALFSLLLAGEPLVHVFGVDSLEGTSCIFVSCY